MIKQIIKIKPLLILAGLFTSPTSAVILVQNVTQVGNSISGNAQDNGVAYNGAQGCMDNGSGGRFDCAFGVVLFYNDSFGVGTYTLISGEVSPFKLTEDARQAWIRRYGSNVPVRGNIPAGASSPYLCFGIRSVIGGYSPTQCVSAPVRPIPPPPTCSGSAGTIDFGSLQQDKYSGVGKNTSINIYCSGAATIRFRSGNNVSLNNGTSATLKFNGVSQGSNFYMRAGNNSVTVDATLSGTPSLGDFTGSSTVILDVL
jgi:hypothetical protein